jgi:hypothetical protein
LQVSEITQFVTQRKMRADQHRLYRCSRFADVWEDSPRKRLKAPVTLEGMIGDSFRHGRQATNPQFQEPDLVQIHAWTLKSG